MNPLENAKELLGAIVESSDDAIMTKNLDGTICSWNAAAQGIFGYTVQEAVGQPATMLIPDGNQDEEAFILQRIRRGERIRHYETIRKAKNGAHLNISLTVSPIITSEGKVVGASQIARDITGEVRAHESVAQSEERFRITLGSIGDAVIATDNLGRITFMNSAAESLTGWEAREALGAPLDKAFNIINEFTRKKCENPVTKALTERKVVALANHTLLISKDGQERPIEDSGSPIRAGGTELKGVVLVFRDVGHRRAAELVALRLAAIIQNSDDAIVGKNLEGIVTSWNEGAQQIFGYTQDEMVGQSIKKIIPQELQPQEDEILARLRKGERIRHFETIRMAKDGRNIPVSLSISPIKDKEGHI
ncbi:MAG TPA: PAS domain S-box protein [Verrucomicrobiae bacterium]|jgi:PAS domain S-box-containing protein